MRYRFYSSLHFLPDEIAQIIRFVSVSNIIGLIFLLGAFLPTLTTSATKFAVFSFPIRILISLILLSAVAYYIIKSFSSKNYFKTFNIKIYFPSPSKSLTQLVLSSLDWLAVGAVFYALLPKESSIGFFGFFAMFLVAQGIGSLSQIPGGLGVFDSAIILLLSTTSIQSSSIIASLLLFRFIYYIIPLIISVILLVLFETFHNIQLVKKVPGYFSKTLSLFVPTVLSCLLFFTGIVLLFSTFFNPLKLSKLPFNETFSLYLFEMSQFTASIFGVLLLFIARGLQKRLESSYYLSLGIVGYAFFFSFLHKRDIAEIIFFCFVFISFLLLRKYFNRRSILIEKR